MLHTLSNDKTLLNTVLLLKLSSMRREIALVFLADLYIVCNNYNMITKIIYYENI